MPSISKTSKQLELPEFGSELEAADWFATHDTASLMDQLEEVEEPLSVVRAHPKKKPVGLRIRADYLRAVKDLAERKGIPYQTLIQMWLVEKLRQEAPELIQPSGQHQGPRQ
jgi:predicted DNA binding CopG/RHH family protein